MKNIFCILLFSLLFSGLSFAGEPSAADMTMRYNETTQKYEVYVRFDESGPISLGGSLISLVLPESAQDQPLVVTSHVGNWSSGSQTYNENGKDFQGILTSGVSKIAYSKDTELLLFEIFSLEKNIRLWDMAQDVQQTTDGTDYLSNIYIPRSGFYIIPEVYNQTTSANTPDAQSFVQVSPNPTTEKITVNSDIQGLKTGTEVLVKIVALPSAQEVVLLNRGYEKTMEFTVRHLPEGTYSILFYQDGILKVQDSFVRMD